MSSRNKSRRTRFQLIVILALLCSGLAALALSDRVLSVSAERGDREAKARAAFSESDLYVRDGVAPIWEYLFQARTSLASSNASFTPIMQAETTLSGTIGVNRWIRGASGSPIRQDVYSHHLETKVVTRLSIGYEDKNNLYAELSPDGEKVAYRGNLDLVIADADGKNPVIIPNVQPAELSWSPDSKHIVFSDARTVQGVQYRPYLIDADGKNLRRIPWSPRSDNGGVTSPSWSPDGKKIYYQFFAPRNATGHYTAQIAVLTLAFEPDGSIKLNEDGSIATTSDVQITSGEAHALPALSPDGSKIAFYMTGHVNSVAANGDIFLMNADGSGKVNLTNTPDYHDYKPVWSPDATRIAFTRRYQATKTTSDREIVSIKPDGSSLIQNITGTLDDEVESWADPCAVPVSSANSSSKSDTATKVTTNTPRCSKAIIVNNTTDDPDKLENDGLCDTDIVKVDLQCSLRAAIQEAKARPGLDTINFNISGGGVHSITPTSALPEINHPVVINGASQPGYNGSPLIALDGKMADGYGLILKDDKEAGKSPTGSTINGLAVVHFSSGGIALQASVIKVSNCYIGINANGTTADTSPDSRMVFGIFALGDSEGQSLFGIVFEDNVISNNRTGIYLGKVSSTSSYISQIKNNKIGADKTGTIALPNDIGIMMSTEFSSRVTITENLISGNGVGVKIEGRGTPDINNNLIGTKVDGMGSLPNKRYGILMSQYTPHPGFEAPIIAKNVIVGSNIDDEPFSAGIGIEHTASGRIDGEPGLLTSIRIEANRIGVAYNNIVIPNKYGIVIQNSSDIVIGTADADRTLTNIIGGNIKAGILIKGNSKENLIGNNNIGLASDNVTPLSNGENGIWLDGNAQSTDVRLNNISGNVANGILLTSGATNNLIHDNKIGVQAPNNIGIKLLGASNNSVFWNAVANNAEVNISLGGLPPGANTAFTEGNNIYGNQIENGKIGIALIEKARNNTIGVINGPGNIPNTIINHRNGLGVGIYIGATFDVINDDLLPSNNKIIGNHIGEPQSGAFSNKIGVFIAQAQNNFIGGQLAPDKNFINANEQDGIRLNGNRTKGNLIGFNNIGIGETLLSDSSYGNGGSGISIDGTGGNSIKNNAIGHNRVSGISISRLAAPAGGGSSAVISGNQIGSGKIIRAIQQLDFKAGNSGFGIRINNSQNVLIGVGGNSPTEPPNVIAANASGGVLIEGAASTLNVINNSIVGTNESGRTDVGNGAHGIYIVGGGENTIGGAASVGNVIVGNGGNGVVLEGSKDNKIYGNRIGVVASGESNTKLANALNGVLILNSSETGIGRNFTPPFRNIISGNTRSGIVIQGADSRLTTIKYNYIGTDSNKTNLGNGLHGIWITEGGRQVTVGGRDDLQAGNTIAFNNAAGIHADPTAGNSIFIDPNTFFGNASLGIDIGAPGTTPNDFGDADVGPNRLQNYPEIISRRLNSDNEFILSYRVTSAPGNSNYGTDGIYVEFFRTDAQGEGEKFLGFDHYTIADYAGGAANPREINLGKITTLGINPNDRLTASATDADGNTSEFFGDTGSATAGSVQFGAATYKVSEGAGTLEITVTRTGPASGPVVASYVLTAGTATAGADYTNATGSVTFADGDVAPKTFNVAVANDSTQEAEEAFKVTLVVTSGSAALGAPVESTVSITDDDSIALTLDPISDLTINEDAPLQTINLSGISVGGGDSQALSVTATSSNTSLIPNPTVSYNSPNSTGSLSFAPVADQSGSALITVTVTKAGGTASVTRTFTVTVNAVNDAPINMVPGAQGISGGAPLTFSTANNNLISIADVDAGASPVQITLTASNGTLSLSGTLGLSFTAGDGTNDAAMTFSGTLSALNAALNGLVFTPAANSTGASSIQITTNDLGNTGAGGPLSDTDTVNITVTERLFQFSSATYTIGEAQGRATITVTRLGGTSETASIDYVTGDLSGLTNCNIAAGNASQRCDYMGMAGTLSFPIGQAAATFDIPIVNDVYIEGPETLTLTLSNPIGGTLGAQSSATLTITDNDNTQGGANPNDDPEFFIRQHYLDFLGREPEPEGLKGWLDVHNNCGTTVQQPCDRIEVSSAFFRSEEFQTRGYFIYRLYSAALGRIPRYSEVMADFARVNGVISAAQLEANKSAFVEEFVKRQEFKDRYASLTDPAAYVDGLLQTVGLQNHPSRGAWIEGLTKGTMTRAQVLRALVESTEVYQKYYTEAFVVMQYFGYLRRDPDILYLNWIQTMNQNGGAYRMMINGFLNSDEYRKRFGP